MRLKDANNIFVYDNTLYIQSNKYGVESITPSRKRETSVHWQQVLQSPCIDYIPLAADRGLAVTVSGVRPIDLTSTDGSPTMTTHKLTGAFDFESRISSVSVDYPYVIAHGLSLVEIWNIEQVNRAGCGMQ